MEQIELAIKIPKFVYDMICKADEVIYADNEIVANAIKNGTILPKEHGALKDIDAIISEHAMTKYDWSDCVDIEDLRNFPTIIEADKEGAEEDDKD